MIIAIDGPAASGKSTTAKILAQQLGLTYIDTGAMYRAIALHILNQNKGQEFSFDSKLDLEDIDLKFHTENSQFRVFLNGKDVSQRIREADISELSSKIALIPEIRQKLVDMQREMSLNSDVVLDGRDIGTVVFPNADYKFYMSASLSTRAKRRWLEQDSAKSKTLEEIENDILWRDNNDSKRSISPLKKAEDAIEIDTSDMSIDEQVKIIMEKLRDVV